MIINEICIGNNSEAFVERNFNNQINLIFSDDNNRGKTIVMQGLYYSLGNEPIFPESFDYKNYYFVTNITLFDTNMIICRNKNDFVIRMGNQIYIYNSVTEFKYFFNKFIYKLPSILKDNKLRMVDLILFYQMFFVGQDARISYNIINHGYYNKDDFINMLYSYAGIQTVISNIDPIAIKEEIRTLDNERKTLLKEHSFLKSNISAAKLTHYTLNKDEIIKKLDLLNKQKNTIVELRNTRNKLWNKKIKNEMLLKELNSLNTTLSEGEIICLDCQSSHIGYKSHKNGINFEVSNLDIRTSIINSINNKIRMYSEECDKLEEKLSLQQAILKELLKDEDVSLENLLIYKNDINQTGNIDARIQQIDNAIVKLRTSLEYFKQTNDKSEYQQKELMNRILGTMSEFYNKVDPKGKKSFKNIFTVKGETFSGSEGALFYLSRIYALAKVLEHPFPIIVDSFRDGELSSSKESIILDLYKQLPNQIIFSSTLKKEEYGKYNKLTNVNKIDYSKHTPHHILNEKDFEYFKKVMNDLLINM